MPVSPPRWPEEALKAERDLSEKRFILERQEEGPAAFYATWEDADPKVRSALRATKNLRQIEGTGLVADKSLWQILRYVCAPRISEEDLWTLVGKKFKNVPVASSDVAAKTLSSLIYMKRFPWVIAGRDPSAA